MNPLALGRPGETPANRRPRRGGMFEALGRGIVRHPWYPVAFWVALLLVALPFLSHLGSVTRNSATDLSSSAPSSQAQHEIETLFPNASAQGETLVVLTGPNITGSAGEQATLAVADRIRADPSLQYVDSVTTLYDAYGRYLAGMAEIALGVVSESNPGSPTFQAVNSSGVLLWSPPATFVQTWEALVAAHPSTPPSQWNSVAFAQTATRLGSGSPALPVLTAFYGGPGAPGFNGTSDCAAQPTAVIACADVAARATLSPLLSSLLPQTAPGFGMTVLAALGIENLSSTPALEAAGADTLLYGSSVPASWVSTVRAQFPSGSASPIALAGWVESVTTSGGLSKAPLPIPADIRHEFVDATDDATVILVAFTESSGFTTSTGATPIFDDISEIDRIVPPTLVASDPSGSIAFLQTGEAPLNRQESTDLSSDIALVVPLTVIVLIGITIAYFRSPLTPLVTFGGLGIAIGLSVGAIILLGTFLTKVDPTSVTLATTFVLGVGTDYAIFLVARYREELVAGHPPDEAVITSVTWAGQSIATSGAVAILSTLALAFSGVALLSQWGLVLSLSVLITLLASLTLVPASLVLIGPRIFWPMTGGRFERGAVRERARLSEGRTYFARAGRLSQRHARSILLVALVASIPIVYLALSVPVAYDFYAQLPNGEPASSGLSTLSNHFGSGYAFPMFLLLTFRDPLLEGGTANPTEFSELSQATGYLASNPSVAYVDSPVGPSGAPLATWLAYPSLPAVDQARLSAILSGYLGTDGRTVELVVQTSNSGLSTQAVGVLTEVRGNLSGYSQAHPELTGVAIGGGAAIDSDLQAETFVATERMVAAVSFGIGVVLFVVLRSWWLPPMAVATIALSIGWAWAITYLVIGVAFARPIFYFVPTILFMLVLGLGTDYNIFLLTRVREERLRGRSAREAAVEGVARTGGVITAAAVILATAFAALLSGRFLLLQSIGFAVAVAIVLDAAVVRTYLVPASLQLLGERVWRGLGTQRSPPDRGAGPTTGPRGTGPRD